MSAATVVKQVFVEFKTMGTAHVSAEIAKTEEQAKRSGRATEAFGKNYGVAARQIASASETMARAGTVSGAAAKQMLAAGSNIAFAFGPAGAIAGAMGIFALAVAQAMGKAREEIERTERRMAEAFNRFSDLDAKAQEKALTRLLRGNRFAGRLGTDAEDLTVEALEGRGLDRLRDDRARLEAELEAARARRRAAESSGDVRGQSRAATQEATLERQLKAVAAAYAELATRAKEFRDIQTETAAAEQLANATDEQRKAAERAAEEAVVRAKRAQEEFQRNAAAFGQDFESLVLRELGSTADQVAASFDALLARGKEFGASAEQLAQIEALRDRAVSAAVAIADVGALLQDLDLAAATGVEPSVDTFVRLTAAADRLRAELAQLSPETEAYRRILAEIEKIEKRRSDLMKGVANSGGGTKPEDVRTTADLAREIQQAADGALQLAQNFAGADASAIGLLRTVAQIAGNLPALQKALKAENGVGIIGAALPIVGALSSLFATNPETAQRRRELAENTAALRELTRQAGQIGLGVSGTAASGAASGLSAFLASGERFRFFDARKAAQAFGLELADLDEIAQAHGITLNENIGTFHQLAEAIGLTITKLGEFGTDLESQLQQASTTARVFGITDPLELLGLTQGTYGGRSPILDQALAGLDLSTAEGRAAARAALQEIFRTMQAGGDTLTAEQLGGLTGDQLLQAILDLIESLNDVDEALGTNTSTVGRPDRVITADRTQITADQASRMLGVQTAQLRELTIIREALVAARTGLPVPSLGAGFASPSGGFGGITITQTFEFHGVVPDTARIAEAATNATIEALDAALGQKLLIQRRFAGEGVRR